MSTAKGHATSVLTKAVAVTLIIPCYNEEAVLPSLLGRLSAMREHEPPEWNVLFVDDGSSDGTFLALLRAAQDFPSWIGVVRHSENLGLGAALRTGFAESQSPIVCTIDSDCTYPPERLTELIASVRAGAAIATASAWHPASVAAQGNVLRLWLSRRVSAIYKRMLDQDVHTFTCLFRAYRRDVLPGIAFRSNGFAAVAEIMLHAILMGHDIREIPMPLESRRYGVSKMRIGDSIMAHAGLMTRTALLVGSRRARDIGRRMAGYAPRYAARTRGEVQPLTRQPLQRRA